ncbi:MAG: SPASM domain-containing protein, partial [Lutibacter sp.]
TYDATINGFELLKKYGVNYSVISTVSKDTLPYAKETFEHLVHLGFKNISYSPVFDSPTGEYPSITCDEWLEYMQCVFSTWFDLGDDKIQIREICEIVSWFNQTPWPCCSSLGTCSHWLVIDPVGNIFPCEKLGKEICFGNIMTDELTEVVSSSAYCRFTLTEKDMPNECLCCQYVNFCNNGCRQMRIKGKKFNARGKYVFCRQRRELFRTIDTRFREVL